MENIIFWVLEALIALFALAVAIFIAFAPEEERKKWWLTRK